MVEVQIPRIQVTCVYCGQSLHEPVDWISLNPVCPNCEASRPLRPSADESRREPRGSRAPGDRNEVSSLPPEGCVVTATLGQIVQKEECRRRYGESRRDARGSVDSLGRIR